MPDATNTKRFCFDIRCGYIFIDVLMDLYKVQLYEYNSKIKDFKVYLKPMHIVVKRTSNGDKKVYYYFGKYWYRVEIEKSRIRWVYLGCKKPFETIPDPPLNPLLIVRVDIKIMKVSSA